MRARPTWALAALLALPALPLAAAPRPASARYAPAVTCDSAQTARDFADGLREYYAGRLPEAIRELESALKREPNCGAAHLALSRALVKSSRLPDAQSEAERAKTAGGDDREQRLIGAWATYVRALSQPENERNKAVEPARKELDIAIALYPDDPEAWLLRAEVAESTLRAAPYYLAALKLEPGHPFAANWTLAVPPGLSGPPAPPGPPFQAVGPVSPEPKLFEGLGKLSYPINTQNPKAQAFFEQGLRCFHSYVTPPHRPSSSSQCFQHAAHLDPTCAMAFWGLSFDPPRGRKNLEMAEHALALALERGPDKERRVCAARVLELSTGKREAFLDALDGAIAAYPEDVELWTWRGKVYGSYGQAGGNAAAMPFQIAAHRLAPDHPAPPHELVHLYEAIERPALGWPHTVAYRSSAYNMPHANHMQAHLAMRLGRWQEALDCTRTSRKKSLEGFPELDPSHHIDVMVRCLAHEGRFAEADAEPKAYRQGLPWARLLQLKADPDALDQWAEQRRTSNSPDGFYIGAIGKLDRGDLEAARPLLERVEVDWKKNPSNLYRYNEIKGRYLVQSGQLDEGLKLLREAAAKAVNDSGLHAWGGGSYMLEVWGEAALRAHRWEDAEEAFHEALAHEHGSVIGALGMQVVWERRPGMPPEQSAAMVAHYSRRAAEIWKGADAGALDRQLTRLRKLASNSVAVGGSR